MNQNHRSADTPVGQKLNGETFQAHFKNIQFARSGRNILSDVDLSLSSNDFILMTGQNGSGKSTLLKIISGLLKPDTLWHLETPDTPNQALVNKKNWKKSKSFLRESFCYLHQTPYLFAGTVYDNIAYGLKRRHFGREKIEQLVDQALNAISLNDLKHRDSRALSGGEKQRVAIARSWVIRPKFILLDEPFANMDKHSRLDCYGLINQLQQDQIGVILTSHDPQDGELSFNRHLHLYQGKISEKPINS